EERIKTLEDGWKDLQLCLATLYMALKSPRDALKCYMRLRAAEQAMELITQYHLLDAVSNQIFELLTLTLSEEELTTAPIETIESKSDPATALLVAEADRGIVPPTTIISQLDSPQAPDGARVLLF